MRCLMGAVRPTRGRSALEIDGRTVNLVGMPTEEIVSLGMAMVPEGRRLFPKLAVEENLLLGAFRIRPRGAQSTEPRLLLQGVVPGAEGAPPGSSPAA